MRTAVAAGLGVLVGALGVGVLAIALGDEEPARSAAPRPPALTTGDCLDLVPDSVFETLGWSAGGAATEHVGRCQKLGDDGSVTVGDRAVVSTAEAVYDEECSGLFDDADQTPDLATDWLPEGTTACARLLPSGRDVGVAELYLRTDDDEVVQIRLVALTPTPPARVEEALTALVAAAERRW